MAFDFNRYYEEDDPESGALKIYWKLSDYSKKVIESDKRNFEFLLKKRSITKLTAMYNYIFCSYYNHAHCSIVHEEGEDYLSGIDDNIRQKLYAVAYSYIRENYLSDKGERQNHKLSKETIKILSNEDNKNKMMDRRAAIYKSPGEYFRAVLEEYAHLPIYEREKYLNIGVYSRLSEYINEHVDFSKRKPWRIEASASKHKTKTYIAYPYKLMPCKNLNHYYLVLVSREAAANAAEKKPFEIYPLRLTHILSLKQVNSYQEGLTAGELDDMAKHIDERLEIVDVPYIKDFCYGKDKGKDGSIDAGIRVKFTDKGIGLLHRIVHNRPEHTEPDENKTCIFKCTKTEIVNYLHNFGKDAVVERPKKVRDALKFFYERAAEAYADEVPCEKDKK